MKKPKRKRTNNGGCYPKGQRREDITPARPSYWYQLRCNINWTQERLAARMDIHRNTVSQYENLDSGVKPSRATVALYKEIAIENKVFFAPPEGK